MYGSLKLFAYIFPSEKFSASVFSLLNAFNSLLCVWLHCVLTKLNNFFQYFCAELAANNKCS